MNKFFQMMIALSVFVGALNGCTSNDATPFAMTVNADMDDDTGSIVAGGDNGGDYEWDGSDIDLPPVIDSRCPPGFDFVPGTDGVIVGEADDGMVQNLPDAYLDHEVELDGFCMQQYQFPGVSDATFHEFGVDDGYGNMLGIYPYEWEALYHALPAFGLRMCDMSEVQYVANGKRNARYTYGDNFEEKCYYEDRDHEMGGDNEDCHTPLDGVDVYGIGRAAICAHLDDQARDALNTSIASMEGSGHTAGWDRVNDDMEIVCGLSYLPANESNTTGNNHGSHYHHYCVEQGDSECEGPWYDGNSCWGGPFMDDWGWLCADPDSFTEDGVERYYQALATARAAHRITPILEAAGNGADQHHYEGCSVSDRPNEAEQSAKIRAAGIDISTLGHHGYDPRSLLTP